VSFFSRLYSFDYMRHKRWWFAISAVVILAGIVSMVIKGDGNPLQGLNYGLEFEEGTRITVIFEQQPTLGELRATLEDLGYTDAQLQESDNVGGSGRAGFQVQTVTLDPGEQQALQQALDEEFGIATDGWQLSLVGPTFGRVVIEATWKAIALALLLILVYVSLRFQWKFAVGAIAAEVHDLLVVVGVYSITGREVTTATIAAVLTILGYSLYDTVIIYDRIRENEPKLSRLPYPDVVNHSIWEVLTRSINTSIIVLIPVLCLLFFGGATLQDFAFALLVGILSGAYSSIFVASPVLTLLKEREPQNRRLQARADEAAQA
jgi:SecD/SecF fusion protein